jgi:hypothetical protein
LSTMFLYRPSAAASEARLVAARAGMRAALMVDERVALMVV